MIHELRELVDFIEASTDPTLKQKIKNLGAKRLELYALLVKEDNVNEESLCLRLYGSESNVAFQKLKSRLYQNLLDIVLLRSNVNIHASNSYNEIRDRCIRNLAIVNLFTRTTLYQNVEYLCKRTLITCEKYEMYDLAVDLLKVLLNLYGTIQRDVKKYKSHLSKYKKYLTIRTEEDDLQINHFSCFSEQKTLSKKSTQELTDIFDKNKLLQICSLPESTFKLRYFAYSQLCLFYDVTKNFEYLYHIANEAAFYMKDKFPKNTAMFISFINLRFIAEIKLKQYDKISETLELFNKLLAPGSFDYYIVNIYKVLLLTHTRKYFDAKEVVEHLSRSATINKISNVMLEYIKICEGYLSFVLEAKGEEDTPTPKFNIFRFLNEIPTYQADKRGVNISVLILHVLFLVEKRKYGQIIDRVDALKQYSYRYLRKDDTFRSNCFIKMIIQMTKANFNPIRTERYTAELFDKLKSVPLELSEQPLEVEIIPYEDLWEIVMQLLERNSKIKRGRPKKKSDD